ncbi:hypothetical protein Tco_1438085 [Tanacetum coccineum]
MKRNQDRSDSEKLHVSLARQTPEHMDDGILATAYPKFIKTVKPHNDKRSSRINYKVHSGSMSSMMKNLDDTFNFGDQFLYDKPTEDDQEKSKVREESESTIPDPNQTVMSTPLVIAPFTDVSSSKPSLLVTPPPINTEATTITTSLPEITPFIALQLRVARLEQEMSEVKKTDHSADVLASIKSQVPTAVDNYLGTKLDDALLKVLERHTADLIEKYSVLPGPESVKNQESEKSPKEIIRAKKEQGEEKQDSTYSIRSTDKVDLEEFDLKSALFKHMNKIKSANRNTANYRLYHALMEALIADEDAMDKEVADKVKDHKRKHDMDVARLKMVVLAVGGDGGDDGEVVVMVLVDVVVAAAGLCVRPGCDDEEGGRLWLAAKVVEVRWGDGGRRDDDGYKVMMKLNKTSIHSRRKKRVLLIMDLELAKKMSLEAHQERVERRGEVSDMGNEILGLSLDPAFSATSGQGKAIVTERTSSSVRLDQILSNEEKIYRPRVMHILYQYLKNAHEDLAGPDPKPMQEDQTRSDSGKVHMSLAGPKPGHYG